MMRSRYVRVSAVTGGAGPGGRGAATTCQPMETSWRPSGRDNACCWLERFDFVRYLVDGYPYMLGSPAPHGLLSAGIPPTYNISSYHGPEF
jgi:hypothetical protein